MTKRGEPVDGLLAGFTGGDLLGVTLYAEDLSDMGKIKIVV